MKLLLDECIPRKLKNHLGAHQCQTVPQAGLAGTKNGELLSLAEAAGFEAFVTLDRGIEYQQNLTGRKLGVLLVRTSTNRLVDLLPLVPEILRVLESIKPGELIRVGQP